jgi:hypothetical protein
MRWWSIVFAEDRIHVFIVQLVHDDGDRLVRSPTQTLRYLWTWCYR